MLREGEAQLQQSLRMALVEIVGSEQYGFPAGAMVHEAASHAPDSSLGLSIFSDSILEMRSEEIERINSSLWRWRLDWFSESV